MAYPLPQTPQRPLPGAFFLTPAASRFQPPTRPPPFQQQQQQVDGRRPGGEVAGGNTGNVNRDGGQQNSQARLQPIQRAARTINEVLQREAAFPDLDSYVRQGISSDYELPDSTTEAGWAPFHRTKMYDIPDTIFEQYNRAEVATSMGLFAELNHAWIVIDNALYLWDYTAPVPEIIGFEEQTNTINAVKLVTPKKGVFVKEVTHLLVVATTSEIILLGLAASTSESGVTTVSIYQTKMTLNIRGINVTLIEGCPSTGRVFFAGNGNNEVYELTYQQDEKWFASRCGKICHTSLGYQNLVPTIWGTKSQEHVRQMVVDDTRRLLYTLSSQSSIRTFYMDSPSTLQFVIEKQRSECLRDISHMISQSDLLRQLNITTISPISAKEGTKLHLMATTHTGCRLFLSATRGYGYPQGQGAPQSMQVQHIKFPPRIGERSTGPTYAPGAEPATEISSRALSFTRTGLRLPPGFFFCFVSKEGEAATRDSLFLSAPDTGRVASQARELTAQATKYYEQGCWLPLNSRAEDVGQITKPFAAADQPFGFGNELAVQFDQPPAEVAVLTNSGVHIIRRRRLVDIFAAALRSGGSDEGLEGEIKKFIRYYGRGETTATALAVACGQGSDVSPSDSRVSRISDPETLELARKAFVEFGGRPSLNENMVSESAQAVDIVRPSARHEGLALYMARLVRSLWKTSVITQNVSGTGVITIENTIKVSKLMSVQEDLTKLQAFLEKNKSFIEGLAGPEGLQLVTSQQDQVALQGEHQALHSLQKLNLSIIEGISFVRMLFEERIDQIWMTLDDQVRQRLRDLTYELLFSTDLGKDLAKTLVKAIVNRNIANGSNVDTVAEALRRRCGSFCSADDVIIFKAQEQLKKASEVGASSDSGRNLLNESLRLFQQVAKSLSYDNLESAVTQFVNLRFYAGAITLSLLVASQSDRGNHALGWLNSGKPANDQREQAYDFRMRCYNLVHQIIQAVDAASAGEPDVIDGRTTLVATKRNEAHSAINDSEDELFQFDLYEWYLSQGWVDRLLNVNSPFVSQFLSRGATESVERADLLWRFHVNRENFYQAAIVQLELAKSELPIPLAKRNEYLSRAKANASTQSPGVGRQARQVLLYEISELLDVANIQDELLSRLKGDSRIPEANRAQVVSQLDGQISDLTMLYNEYADQASYHDLCIQIYDAADHRNAADISATWQHLIDATHTKALEAPGHLQHQPYEAVIDIMKEMSTRLGLSELTYSPQMLIPMLEKYALENQRNVGSDYWVPDLFIDVGFPHEILVSVLQQLWYGNVIPFTGAGKRYIAMHLVHVIEQWYEHCIRGNEKVFGNAENEQEVLDLLGLLQQSGLEARERDVVASLRRRIERSFR